MAKEIIAAGKPANPAAHTGIIQRGRPAISIIRDIRERLRAKHALRESDGRFRDAFEHAVIGMALLAPDGRFLQVNRSFSEMLGYSEQELTSATWQTITDPDDLGLGDEQRRRMLSGEIDSGQAEKRYLRKDGHVIWALIDFTVIRGTHGSPLRFIAQIQDITERKRAEEELRESEERYRQLVELSPDAVAVHQDGKVVFANTATAELVGAQHPGQIISLPIAQFVHPAYQDIVRERLQQLEEEGGQLRRIEQKFVRLDGTYVDVDAAAAAIIYRGRPAVQMVARDITGRKRMEEALQAAREELEGRVERQLLRRNPYGLTFRELTVLHLVAAGRADREIGIDLAISHLTAQKHVSNILAKMDAASRTEAAARAVRERLLE